MTDIRVTMNTITRPNGEVATVIKRQIGIWALAEVGARGFSFDAHSLYFDAKPGSRIVRVIVTLDRSDTYTVRVVDRSTGNEKYRIEGIYAEDLAGTIRTLPTK